jgi:hypothetical protein
MTSLMFGFAFNCDLRRPGKIALAPLAHAPLGLPVKHARAPAAARRVEVPQPFLWRTGKTERKADRSQSPEAP